MVSKFILNAKEIEFDGVAQEGKILNYAISEHVEVCDASARRSMADGWGLGFPQIVMFVFGLVCCVITLKNGSISAQYLHP